MKNNDTNVYGQPLQVCSYKPLTGYDRNGYCSSSKNDKGKHWVCGKMDKEFLQFTKKKGNDLIISRKTISNKIRRDLPTLSRLQSSSRQFASLHFRCAHHLHHILFLLFFLYYVMLDF